MKKVCISCEQEKVIERFDKRVKSKDGRRNQCKDCMCEKRKKRFDSLSEEDKIRVRGIKIENNKKYLQNNPEFKLRISKTRRANHIKRLKNDPLYKLRIAYTRRLNKSMKGMNIKRVCFLEKLGCSLDEFRVHIEQKFETWMSWANYGRYNGELNYGLDIDHIIPISSAKTEEFYILSHYTNMQPLCSKVNRDIKKNKIEKTLSKRVFFKWR